MQEHRKIPPIVPDENELRMLTGITRRGAQIITRTSTSKSGLKIIERIGPNRQKQFGDDRPVYIHNLIERVNTKHEVQDFSFEAMKRRSL